MKHATVKTVWSSGLRRWLKAPVRKGVDSNPTAVTRLVNGATTKIRRRRGGMGGQKLYSTLQPLLQRAVHLARIELATFSVLG